MEYRVLSLPEDEGRWKELVPETAETDVYFTAGYYATFGAYEDAGARLFVYEEDGDRTCFPFLLRRIGEGDLHDVTTAYGYGGFLIPPARRGDRAYARNLIAALDDHYARARVVSEFIRFHPVLETHVWAPIETRFVQPTVAVDTATDPEAAWERYSSSQRRAVRKARKAELDFRVDADPGRLESFAALYGRTMRRVGASEWYLFPETLLREHFDRLAGHIRLASVYHDSRMIAGALLLCWDGRVHYHLGASEADALSLRPNNWLFHKVIEWAHENGFRVFHLGGGVGGEDSLYRFKLGLDREGRREFHVGRRIVDPEAYRSLVEAWRDGLPEGAEVDEDFFPLYRARVSHE
jgi:hypothetical protein